MNELLTTLFITYCYVSNIQCLTDVTEDIVVDSTFFKNLAPYVIKRPITVKSTATLTIEAGTEVQVDLGLDDKYSFAIKVEGSLLVHGTERDTVAFTVSSSCDKQCNALDTHTGQTTIQHASFRKFQTAVYLKCCHEGSTLVEDTLFEENGIAVSGYRGTMTTLKRCTFRRNDRGVDSADKNIEDSQFEENVECAVCGVERTKLTRCIITGHRGSSGMIVAVGGKFSTIEDCIVTNNDIGIRSYEGTFKRNMISANGIGFLYSGNYNSYFPTMTENNICGNNVWNIQYMGTEDWHTSGNWYGSSDERLVRGSIEDAYHVSQRGRLLFGSLPTRRISTAAGQDLACPAPVDKPDFTLDGAWMVGNIFEDTVFEEVNITIEHETSIYPGATLTIKAGVHIHSKATITVKGATLENGSRIYGSLNVEGTAQNPVIFSGPLNSDSNTNYFSAIDCDLGRTGISHALFEHFTTVITLRCCESGPSVNVEDTEFRRNHNVVNGYMGHNALFKRCTFSDNKRCFSNADYEIEDSVFDSNDCGLCGVERTTVRRSTFRNHRQYAIGGRGPEISDSLVEHNPLGIRTSEGGFTLKGNTFNNNSIALHLNSHPGTILENNVCNTEQWNVYYTGDEAFNLENNYWGEPSGDINIIRSGIRDAYHDSNIGLANIGTLRRTPYNTIHTAPSPCNAPLLRSNFSVEQSSTIFVDRVWSGEITITEPVVVQPNAQLTILAGTTVTMLTTLRIKGSLKVEGTANSRVIFRSAEGRYNSQAFLDGDNGESVIQFALFEDFYTAIRVSCCHEGKMSIRDTIFRNNRLVHSGYMGTTSRTTFTRCRFENNDMCLTNADKLIEDSVFDSNGCALCGVERMVVHRCLFKNHRNYAVGGRGPEITDSVFINNKVGYQNTGDGGFVFQRNVVTGGETGVIATHPHPAIRENNICGNSVNNFELQQDTDLNVGCNWFGIGNEIAARGKIKDGWKSVGVGIARLDPIALAPYNIGHLTPENVIVDPCISRICDATVDCNDHGMCSVDGLCVCLPGWSGERCEICEVGLIPSPLGEVCAKACNELTSCTTCLSSSRCGWCIRPEGGRCISVMDSDTSQCSTVTQKHCLSDTFGISQSRFQRTGTSVVLTFNAPTETSTSLVGRFDCSKLLTFDTTQNLGSGQECQWISPRQLNIYLGPGFRLRPTGIIQQDNTTITLRNGVIKKQNSQETLQGRVIEVLPPEIIPQPVAIVKFPTFSGTCADLVLDGTVSNDPTGQLHAMWKILTVDQEAIERYLRDLFCGCTENSCRNDNMYSNSETVCTGTAVCPEPGLKLIIPRRLLSPNEDLEFQLFVSNVLGLQSSSNVVNVTVSEQPQLIVRMLTPTLRIHRNKLTEIKVSVHLPDCGYNDPPKPELQYDWTWNDPDIEIADPTASNMQRGIVSRKASLFILPYTLSFDTNIVYYFNATVNDLSGNYEGTTVSAKITVIREPLHLALSGDGATFNYRDNIMLSAIAIDPMAHIDDGIGTFKWKCFQILDDDVKVQSLDVSGFTGPVINLVPPSVQGFPLGTYEFKLKWSKEYREAQVAITVHITNSTTAKIQIVKPINTPIIQNRLYIGPKQIIHLQATTSVNSTITWSVHEGTGNVGEVGEFLPYILTEVNKHDFIIQSDAFHKDIDYIIKIKVTSEELATSETFISVALPIYPKGGHLSVEPCKSSAHAFSTNFHIVARDWMLIDEKDATLQLEYFFGYNTQDTTVYLSPKYSTDNEVETKLPEGNIELWVKIRSPSGETSASVTCRVQAASSTLNDQEVLGSTLDNTEEADNTINAAALQANNNDLSNQQIREKKSALLEVKQQTVSSRLGLPLEDLEIHKCMSDLVHILTAGDNSSLDTADVPTGIEIVTTCTHSAASGILKETAETGLEAIGSLSSVDTSNTDSQRRKRAATRTDLQLSIHNIYRGTADTLVSGAKPIYLYSTGIKSIVVRDETEVLAGRTLEVNNTQKIVQLPEDIWKVYDGPVDLFVTFWRPGFHHAACHECTDLAADLISISVQNIDSEVNLLDSITLTTSTTYKSELHPRAKHEQLQCVHSDDTLQWSTVGCENPSVQGRFVECHCLGLHKYYTVSGELSQRNTNTREPTSTVDNGVAAWLKLNVIILIISLSLHEILDGR